MEWQYFHKNEIWFRNRSPIPKLWVLRSTQSIRKIFCQKIFFSKKSSKPSISHWFVYKNSINSTKNPTATNGMGLVILFSPSNLLSHKKSIRPDKSRPSWKKIHFFHRSHPKNPLKTRRNQILTMKSSYEILSTLQMVLFHWITGNRTCRKGNAWYQDKKW